jgi:hypothetical protein
MPIGFRRENAGVSNAQLLLAKKRAKLQEAELELSHQLAYAVRDMEAAQVLSETNFNRRIAAQRQVDAVAAAWETGTINIDVLLDSQRRLAQAESDYYRSVINYNKAIMQVHYRKGSLLEYNGVYLAEGPWPGKAYFDARRRARSRDAATYIDYGFTQPRVFSAGAYQQNEHSPTGYFGEDLKKLKMNESARPETIPAPEGQPQFPTDAPVEPAPPTPVEPTVQPNTGASWVPSAARAGQKTRDLGSLNVNESNASPVRQASAVEPAARSNDTDNSRIKWTNTTTNPTINSDTDHEPSSNPPAAESDRPASGWKGVSR